MSTGLQRERRGQFITGQRPTRQRRRMPQFIEHLERRTLLSASAEAASHTVMGMLWQDDDRNGIRDGWEWGIDGIYVALSNADGDLLDATYTDWNGAYQFSDDFSGMTLQVSFHCEGLFSPRDQAPEHSGMTDSDVDRGTGRTSPFSFATGQSTLVFDAGVYLPWGPAVFGRVWNDENGDGIQSSTEKGVAGVQIEVYDAMGWPYTATSEADGFYLVEGMMPSMAGSVRVVVPDGALLSPAGQGWDQLLDSDFDAAGHLTLSDFYGPVRADAGLILPPPTGVTGRIWHDMNANGIQDAGESGQADIRVELLEVTGPNAGTLRDSTTTDGDGIYRFAGLTPGTPYRIVINPSGMIATFANVGSDDSIDSDLDMSGWGSPFTVAQGQMVDVDCGLVVYSILRGYVFHDSNNDNVQQPTEPGLGGWTVFFDRDGDGVLGPLEDSVTTRGFEYDLIMRTAGQGRLMLVPQDGWALDMPYNMYVSRGAIREGYNFGNSTLSPVSTYAPWGPDLDVNQALDANVAAIGMAASGEFAVAWLSGGGLHVQRYDAGGAAAGERIDVVEAAPGMLGALHLAMNSAGQFVVTWAQDGAILARRYAADGTALGGILDVSGGLESHGEPQVAMSDTGGFAIAWLRVEGDPGRFDAMVRAYGMDGEARGPALAASAAARMTGVRIGIDGLGRFLVAWDPDGAIHARRFQEDGSPQALEFVVMGSVDESNSALPAVAMAADGTAAIAWFRNGGTFLQRYNSNGVAQGMPVSISIDTDAFEPNASVNVGIDSAGNMTVAFGLTSGAMYLRRYNAAGSPLGGVYPIADDPFGTGHLALGVSAGGAFAAAWASDQGLHVRRYTLSSQPLASFTTVCKASPRGNSTSLYGWLADPFHGNWTGSIDYGDGTPIQAITLRGGRFFATHTYMARGTYTATVTFSGPGGQVETATALVAILPTGGWGTQENNHFVLRLDPTGKWIQFFENSPVDDTPDYVIPRGKLGNYRFYGRGDNNTLLIDMTHGNPLSDGALGYDGYGGNDTLILRGGSMTITKYLASLENLVVEQAQVTLANEQWFDTLSIHEGSVTLEGEAALYLTHLQITPGSTLDLAGNMLVMSSDSERNVQDLIDLTALIASGRTPDGNWSGWGINSSFAAADPKMTLVAFINDRGDGTPILTQGGLTPTDIIVRYGLAGDLDFNGIVDGDDYFAMDRAWLTSLTGGYLGGDLDYNGTVDARDYFILDRRFLEQSLPPTPAAAPPVPIEDEDGLLWLKADPALAEVFRR